MFYQKIINYFSLFSFDYNYLAADTPYFLDFKKILNQSEAGKKAQTFLKNKLDKGIKNIKDKEKNYKKKREK